MPVVTCSPLQQEINSLSAWVGATGSYANVRFLPANPELPTLERGLASRTEANEPQAGGAGPGSFKPLAKGPVRRQCWVLWPQPSPRPACPCRGSCVCLWSIPPAPCVWLAWRPSWTFMGKSQRPGVYRPLVLISRGSPHELCRASSGLGCLLLSLGLGTPVNHRS